MTSAMGEDMTRTMDGGQPQGERLQTAASGLVDQAARTAEARASTTMTQVGETVGQVADAIREASGRLREQQPEVAGFVDTAATRLESAGAYLRERDAREVIESVQETARRQPALVVGGGLVLGILLGRFLKSGSSQSGGSGRDWERGAGYGGSYASGYGATDYAGGTSGYASGVAGGYGAAGSSYAGGTTGLGSDLGTGADAGTANEFATGDDMGDLVVDADVVEIDEDVTSDSGTRR